MVFKASPSPNHSVILRHWKCGLLKNILFFFVLNQNIFHLQKALSDTEIACRIDGFLLL